MPESEFTQPSPFRSRRRPRAAGVVVLSIAWFLAARIVADRSATGITVRLGLSSLQPLVMSAFLLFLLGVGILLMKARNSDAVPPAVLFGLPKRPTRLREWGFGAAIGWAAALFVVLPVALLGDLHPEFWFAPRALWLTTVALVTLALFSLAEEIVFRGLAYRRLIASIGAIPATLLMTLLYGAITALIFGASATSFLLSLVFGLLLSIAWLRTYGLWISWGLHFAWKASLSVLFGAQVVGPPILSSIISSQPYGPSLLTGGSFGLESSTLAVIALLLSIPVLYRVTREYAWNYTHPVIVPGGYAVDVLPPKAHTELQRDAPLPPPLIQILPSTPQDRSRVDPPI